MRTFLLPVALTLGTSLLTLSACSGDDEDAGGARGGVISSEATPRCVDLINQYRASAGLSAYERWTSAEQCTGQQAQSAAASGDAHGAFGSCDENAQNVCPGWDGPPEEMIDGCLEMMMGEGPGGGHYDNMMSPRYTEVACGFYTLPDGEVWAVQNFR